MITWSDLRDSFWLAGFLFVVSFLIFLLIYGIAYAWHKSTREGAVILAGFLSGLPIGFTGMVAGFLTGSSRSPAVNALVPAILTFIGLIVVYMIGKGRLRNIIAGFTVFVFSADLLVGTDLGSASRERHEELLGSVKIQKLRAEGELAIRLYRKGLGLPLDVPKPASPGAQP
jgi:hypothetical protein